MGNNYPWIKLGHFEVPFGIEYTKNTFGNLHQYAQGSKLGMKMDWGLAIGQELLDWQYEFALTRGSGLKYREKDNHAYSGRVSTLTDSHWGKGISFFHGDILMRKETIKRELLAIDLEYNFENFGFITEIHKGQINSHCITGGLFEVNWKSFDEQNEIYIQYFLQKQDNLNQHSSLITGASYSINQRLTASCQFMFEIEQRLGAPRSNIIEFQIRYTF